MAARAKTPNAITTQGETVSPAAEYGSRMIDFSAQLPRAANRNRANPLPLPIPGWEERKVERQPVRFAPGSIRPAPMAKPEPIAPSALEVEPGHITVPPPDPRKQEEESKRKLPPSRRERLFGQHGSEHSLEEGSSGEARHALG